MEWDCPRYIGAALRHMFGEHLSHRGVSMPFIRDLLGHHCVSLTEKYGPPCC
jgi:site-specific recombinase XerD